MNFWDKMKMWFQKNKKYVIIGGTIVLTIVGIGVGYVICKNQKISFTDWLKSAPEEELYEVYKKMQLDFYKTGTKAFGMEEISQELGDRGATEWFEKHPPNPNPNFRWTDANRWE